MSIGIFLINILKSGQVFITWLQKHLLPCPFKYITGIDCPFCGFQRSVLALVFGDFHKSFLLYPATAPLLLLFVCSVLEKRITLNYQIKLLKNGLAAAVILIIVISYLAKLWVLMNR